MKVNNYSEVTFKGTQKQQEIQKQPIPQLQTNPLNEAPMPSSSLLRVMKGVAQTVARPKPTKYTPQKASDRSSSALPVRSPRTPAGRPLCPGVL